MPHYGNYVGPFWSDGKRQESVDGVTAPIDAFDQTAQTHDREYYYGNDLLSADMHFARDNLFTHPLSWNGLLRNVAGCVVGAQGALRLVGILPKRNLHTNKPMPIDKNMQFFTPYFYPDDFNINRHPAQPDECVVGGDGYCDAPVAMDAPVVYTPDEQIAYAPVLSQTRNTPIMVPSDRYNVGVVPDDNTPGVIIMSSKTKNMSLKTRKRQNPPNKSKKTRQPSVFGPVSTINTAPVAIGNSIRGAKPRINQIVDGVRVTGRDFAFALKGTVAAAADWSLVGGMPLTPSVLPSSILRNYVQMYSKFKVNRVMYHYITSSATSQTGDVLFYYERDILSPMFDFTNASFLPAVLSDPHTIIGPQWTNHTLLIEPTDGYNYTNYGMNLDINETVCGSVYLFSKTSTASSPGYVLCDYDISFKELNVNPRAGVLPVSRGQCNYVTMGLTAIAVTINSTSVVLSVQGLNPDGSASANPNGTLAGDIFKCVALVTDSTVSGTNAAWTNVTAATLLDYPTATGSAAVIVDDGFTFYSGWNGTNHTLFPNLTDAIANVQPFRYGVTATVTANLCCMCELVYSSNSSNQNSY